MKPLIEVRVPTYKRPALLKRALESVVAQSYDRWVCIVFDDSPAKEGEAVVASLNDARFQYKPNHERLGGAGNIDRAFSPESLSGGQFACILEDDNWFYSGFLEKNLAVSQDQGADLVLRNQSVWIQTETGVSQTQRTTRGQWFEEGWLNPELLHASLYLFEGISNGGLFWKLDVGIDLRVGPTVSDSGLQEYCRTWQISTPVWFAADPEAVWVSMDNSLVVRSILNHRSFSTGKEIIARIVYRHYGPVSIERAQKIAQRRHKESELRGNLVRAGVPGFALQSVDNVLQWTKAFVRRLTVKNPLSAYPF